MPDHLQVEVREVRQLVRNHHGVDDGRAVDGKGLADRSLELTRRLRRKSVPTPGARERSALDLDYLRIVTDTSFTSVPWGTIKTD